MPVRAHVIPQSVDPRLFVFRESNLTIAQATTKMTPITAGGRNVERTKSKKPAVAQPMKRNSMRR
jgi:hypothetical protein